MSQQNREHARRRQVRDQRGMQAESTQQSVAVQAGMRDEETAKNPEFLDEFAGVELDDSRIYDWLTDELGPVASKVHALGNRSEEYAFEQRLLNRNLAERFIAEHTPGRQLRQHPKLHYLAQGCRGIRKGETPGDDPEYRAPLDDQDRRIIRSAIEAITAHQSRSQEHMGADAVSKVQTESRTVQDDRTEESSARSVRKKVFG